MSDTDEGGTAFPFTPTDRSGQCDEAYPGMTLRDYFAGQCLVGELSAQTEESGHYNPDGKALAERCYAFADAMIAARKTKEGRSNG